MLLPFSQHVLMARWIWLATGDAIYFLATYCYLEESCHVRTQSTRAEVKKGLAFIRTKVAHCRRARYQQICD